MASKVLIKKEAKFVCQYSSQFGSHTSMINKDETAKLSDTSLVVLTDENGDYTTFRNRLDTGLADPLRYVTSRLACLK